MEPFSTNLLTILVLVCISLTGLTFFAVLVITIVFLCKCCTKGRRSKIFIQPVRTQSIGSISNRSPSNTSIPLQTIDQQKKFHRHHSDTLRVVDEYPYFYHQNKYQQQGYMQDDNDETTTRAENRMYLPRPQIRQYQSVKPLTSVRISDRHTPYPADVLAREKLMVHTRFPVDDKY